MGAIFSSNDKVGPVAIDEVQTYDRRASFESNDDQSKFKKRVTTDVCSLLFFTTFLIVLLCFVGYCILDGDIYRVINGYDNCGNVCGRSRPILRRDENRERCQETIQTFGPYHILLKDSTTKTAVRLCVSNCSEYEGYRKFFNRCIPYKSKTVVNTFFSKTGLKNFFTEVSEDFHFCWREFVYLCLISLVLSLVILALFRYLVGFVVWIVLIGAVVACVIGTIVLWMIWKQAKDSTDRMSSNSIPDVDSRKTQTYLVFAIVATVVTAVIILIIFVMRKRIKLVVQLFEEAGKALAVMPVLLFEPILTFLCLVVVVCLWFYFCLWIESSGILSEKRPMVYYYEKDTLMKVTRWYNFFAMLWMAQFVIGCQHMVIAGAVAKWYFTRTKSKLDSPVCHSFCNLTRYHLGSVALGSFLIATVQFLRVILKILEKYLKGKQGKCVEGILKCCQCCLYCFEKILKYLSRNAYVEVAIYGYTFCEAGQQAFKLLSSNLLRVAAINSVGDFVLFLGKVVVVLVTVLIGIKILQNKEGVQHIWVPLTLAGLFAYLISHCFMTVYEMAIDTIFLCFCEDCEQNDGLSRPYFMSRGLMEFVDNSKRALDLRDSRRNRSDNFQEEINTVAGDVDKKRRRKD
ncbi:choline transporter-like protein 1 [Anoplophora glabripennis]|uniref:choline transporter-like protein 1 n=1 Tax=Anoplophora glabripennis TaxID=217634 RepID=UPI000875516A|nr:choline transporter-like protein 1 [Anoplophora glabripennis]